MKVYFFLPQTAQFDKNINLFCLVFLTLEFSFAVFSLQLTEQVSIVFFISSFTSLYSLNTLFTGTNPS